MSNKLYKLELVRGYPQDLHHRAGLVLSRGGALVTELTDDQLEAVKNDTSITLSEATEGEQTTTPDLSEGAGEGAGVADIQSDGAAAPDRSASEEDEAVEDLGAESEEAPAGETVGDAAEVADEAAAVDAAQGDAASDEQAAEDQAVAQSTADQVAQEGTENASDEAPVQTAEDLARDNDRPTLNKLALEAGVVEPEKLQNKLEVAAALLEKRA